MNLPPPVRRLSGHPELVLLHAALLLIAAGLALTHFCSRQGTVSLRTDGGAVAALTTGTGDAAPLPFALRLTGWSTITYPSTPTPMDYLCTLSATAGGRERELTLRMNRAVRIAGWKIILDSYDSDNGGVTLLLRYDPAGTWMSFAGYALFVIAMSLWLANRASRFRRALAGLRHAAALTALLIPLGASAGLPASFVSGFGSLMVLHNGRVAPVATLAAGFTSDITGGRAGWEGHDACGVMAGFLFDFAAWKGKPLIKVGSEEMRRLLGVTGRRASYADYMGAVASGRLDISDPDVARRLSADIRRFEAVNMLLTGELLKIYPISSGGVTDWYSPADDIPADIPSDRWIFIRKSLGVLNSMVLSGDFVGASRLLTSLRRYQEQASGTSISPGRLRAELLYNRVGNARGAAICMLAAGILVFVLGMLDILPGRFPVRLLPLAALVWLTGLIALRWYVGGHVPLANGFETMQFTGWCVLLAGIFSSFLAPLSLAGAGLCLLTASFSGASAGVTPLMPVLSSPLLSIHVVCVMGAYALFLLMALTSAVALATKGSAGTRARMVLMPTLLLYPAELLLAAGIFTGAVWADISWGEYWSWDPKEVGALATFIVYSLPMHPAMLRWLSRPKGVHIFMLLAFATVLFTWFGVTALLGGRHAYA